MKILSFILLVVAISFSAQGWASGIVTVSGKLASITETQYVVETPNSTYYIKKNAVSPAEAEKLTKAEVQVSIAVPFDAVERVKTKPKTAKK